jgi:hypothetical protein
MVFEQLPSHAIFLWKEPVEKSILDCVAAKNAAGSCMSQYTSPLHFPCALPQWFLNRLKFIYVIPLTAK